MTEPEFIEAVNLHVHNAITSFGVLDDEATMKPMLVREFRNQCIAWMMSGWNQRSLSASTRSSS